MTRMETLLKTMSIPPLGQLVDLKPFEASQWLETLQWTWQLCGSPVDVGHVLPLLILD